MGDESKVSLIAFRRAGASNNEAPSRPFLATDHHLALVKRSSVMSAHHRAGMPSETDALYQPIPREDPAEQTGLRLEDDEEALAEEFVAQ